jgi:hypothetical protein
VRRGNPTFAMSNNNDNRQHNNNKHVSAFCVLFAPRFAVISPRLLDLIFGAPTLRTRASAAFVIV